MSVKRFIKRVKWLPAAVLGVLLFWSSLACQDDGIVGPILEDDIEDEDSREEDPSAAE